MAANRTGGGVKLWTPERPPMCGCCGSPCPISWEWRDDPYWELSFICLVCEAARLDGYEATAGGSTYRLWDGSEWVEYDGPWRYISDTIATTDPRMAVAVGYGDAAGRSPRRAGPNGRGHVRCLNPRRYGPGRCGASNHPDLRDSRAWRHLVAELHGAGLLDVSRRLAIHRTADSVTGEILDENCYLTGSLQHFGPTAVKTMQLHVFQSGGSRGYLSVDVFDGSVSFQTHVERDAADARELLAQWRSASADPVREGAACVALHTAFWRHGIDRLVRAHVWLSVALLDDPEIRALGVELARRGQYGEPATLRAALADATGMDDLRVPPPYGSPTDMLDPETRNVWDVWLFEQGPYG
jgi:hypothetical protein